MRDIYQVIAEKESELQQVVQQLEALRLAARLLADDSPQAAKAAANGDSIRAAAPRAKVFP